MLFICTLRGAERTYFQVLAVYQLQFVTLLNIQMAGGMWDMFLTGGIEFPTVEIVS